MGLMRYGSLINQTSVNGRQTVMLCRDVLKYKEGWMFYDKSLKEVFEGNTTQVLPRPHREAFSQAHFTILCGLRISYSDSDNNFDGP